MPPFIPVSHPAAVRPAPRLAAWLFLTVAINVLLATGAGYGGDIGYWLDWIGQLQDRGYTQLKANYPPLYVQWLWLLARGYEAFEVAPVAGDLLRMLVNTPVLLAHLLLVWIAHVFLRKADADERQSRYAMAFTVFNPALLLDGPLWGQVDLVFCVFVVLALYTLISGRYLLLSLPLLVIALLTKFQTVSVLPVVLALLWHRRQAPRLWQGLLPAGLIALLLFLPYLLAGSAISMIDQAYLEASSLYPLATMHAMNLWYLLGFNSRPDTWLLLSPGVSASGLGLLITPKWLGLGACALWCLYLLIDSVRCNDAERHWRNAILCATGFFVLLPGMHERYLVPAVVIALVAAARYPAFRKHALMLSVLSAANIIFILRPNTGLLPYVVSALTVGFAFWWITPSHWRAVFASRVGAVPARTWGAAALLVWGVPLAYLLNRQLPDSDGWISASRVTEISSRQDWESLQIDKAVSGSEMNIDGRRFRSGLGTHAASSITLTVPRGASEFAAFVGMDQAAGKGGSVRFLVFVDGKQRWDSGSMQHDSPARELWVSLEGARKLELRVDPLGSNYRDHANWADARFRLVRQKPGADIR